MTKMVLDKQLVITVNSKVGTLAEVTNVISSSGINLIAICAYAVDNQGVVMFVTEDNENTKNLLRAKGYDLREEDVILLTVANKPGTLKSVTEKIAEIGIDVTLIYGSVDQKEEMSRLVLITENNQTVFTALKMM